MMKLCEACYARIGDDEPHVTLRALYKVSASGRPLWRSLYLHRFDPESDRCALTVRRAPVRERRVARPGGS
jgi:hypothetical protein